MREERIALLPRQRSVAVCLALRIQPPPILIIVKREKKEYYFRIPLR